MVSVRPELVSYHQVAQFEFGGQAGSHVHRYACIGLCAVDTYGNAWMLSEDRTTRVHIMDRGTLVWKRFDVEFVDG